uniref:DUF4283 domain-containing protein n=1 Tax=Chenopodium quinoa TaxID=63459 RepID=A0A803N8R1_CHEQI
MVDTQWLTRGNIIVHRTGCYYVFACSHVADVEALLEQHSFVLDGRICNVGRCNRFTIPANVNFDITRLWVRVYGLPFGLLDLEWAFETLKLVGVVETLDYDGDGLPEEPEFRGQLLVDLSKPLIPGCFVPGEFDPLWVYFRYEGVFLFCKKCGVVGHDKEFCHFSDYVAARRVHARLEEFEAQGYTVLFNPNNRPLYTNMIEGTQEVFSTRNTRVNLLVLAQDFEYEDSSSGNDTTTMDGDNDNSDNNDGNSGENDDEQEPPDDNAEGDENPDSDASAEPDNSDDSDSNSSGAGDDDNQDGQGNDVAPNGDNNDNIEPEFIPINGIYENGYMSHHLNGTFSSSSEQLVYKSASDHGNPSTNSSETDPTTPESYHNPHSQRFAEENHAIQAQKQHQRVAIPVGDPYAPFTANQSQARVGGGF